MKPAPGKVGLNGITHEALLAILIDRLEGFQSGPYKSYYNADALYYLKAAMDVLHRRTRDRMAQGSKAPWKSAKESAPLPPYTDEREHGRRSTH